MHISIVLSGFAVLFTTLSPVLAQTQAESITSPNPLPVYVPPQRSAPVRRIGGGSRRPGVNVPALYVLAPDHTGLTTKKQPTLYWFVSGRVETEVRFVLLEEGSIDPVLETNLGAVRAGGIHKLSLADHGIALRQGVDYQWFITMVADPVKRSKDIVSGGTIRLVEPSTRLRNGISDANNDRMGFVYADNGIWYDAIDILSSRIEQSPHDGSLRAQRAALLEQVDLTQVAVFDRRK